MGWQYNIAAYPENTFGTLILPVNGIFADRFLGVDNTIYVHPNGGWGWDRDSLWNVMNGPDHGVFNTTQGPNDMSTLITTNAFDLDPGASVDIITWTGEPPPSPMQRYLAFELRFVGFYRGDAHCDGELNLGDAIHIAKYYFGTGIPPQPFSDQGDVNGDRMVNLADAMHLAHYYLGHGTVPIDYARFPNEIPIEDQESISTEPGYNLDWENCCLCNDGLCKDASSEYICASQCDNLCKGHGGVQTYHEHGHKCVGTSCQPVP